jgi:nitrile hydratase
MEIESQTKLVELPDIVFADREQPVFAPNDRVRILIRSPIGHYRVPRYLRGRAAVIEAVIEPAAVDNEEEGYGRNAGSKRHYYRVAVPMTEIWPTYSGPAEDSLRIEIFETWLEGL